ncbi:MAG: S41 family peptidase [Paludibacteraceae bacterium]|nr:S41 family peptidase [Paludibacteraceae bacterium]
MKKHFVGILALMFNLAVAAQNNNQRTFEISKNLDIYSSILHEIEQFYVDSIDYSSLVQESINQMLSGLDPYTVYIPESKEEELKMMTSGEYGGIGAIIMQRGNEVVISEPYEGMPAQVVDLRCGDVLLEIDGKSLEGKNTSEVSNLLKGVPGTQLELKIKRQGEKKSLKKTIVRKKIQLHPVPYFGVVNKNVGFIQLSEFTDKATNEFRMALDSLVKKDKITSLIIDLRDNGGGLINEACKIASLFVPKGTEIVSTKGKDEGQNFSYETTSEPSYETMPLVVLVNGFSASASEILAGAFQDLDRATIIGTKTFGKGLIQGIRQMPYKGFLKLTTARYYTPSGRCVQAINYNNHTLKSRADNSKNVFFTKSGRMVLGGGGITPDSILNQEKKVNIAFHLYSQLLMFDFATNYAKKHRQIATADIFSISEEDYREFVAFVKEKNFTYKLKTEELINALKESAKYEGYESLIVDEIKSLSEKLKPNIEKEMEECKADIIDFINFEIIKRYYFQKGTIQYNLRDDELVKKAVDILTKKS